MLESPREPVPFDDDEPDFTMLDAPDRSAAQVIAHMAGETARHAGLADILRELSDGVTGR